MRDSEVDSLISDTNDTSSQSTDKKDSVFGGFQKGGNAREDEYIYWPSQPWILLLILLVIALSVATDTLGSSGKSQHGADEQSSLWDKLMPIPHPFIHLALIYAHSMLYPRPFRVKPIFSREMYSTIAISCISFLALPMTRRFLSADIAPQLSTLPGSFFAGLLAALVTRSCWEQLGCSPDGSVPEIEDSNGWLWNDKTMVDFLGDPAAMLVLYQGLASIRYFERMGSELGYEPFSIPLLSLFIDLCCILAGGLVSTCIGSSLGDVLFHCVYGKQKNVATLLPYSEKSEKL